MSPMQRAATSPPPSWGRVREGGMAERPPSGLPPPPTPPHVMAKPCSAWTGEGRTSLRSSTRTAADWHGRVIASLPSGLPPYQGEGGASRVWWSP